MTVPPIVRQLVVAGAPLLAAFSVGGSTSYPTVLLYHLKANNTSIHLDFDTASWIGSIHGLAGIPTIFMPALMQWKGRKFAFITACLVSLLGWILAYFANSATLILISEIFHGLGSNSIYSVSSLSITEMISPANRDNVLQLYFVFDVIGMAADGLLAQFVSTKTICIIMFIPMLIAVFMACIWPESPYWLAYKRKYSKCEAEFNWLRGKSDISKKELDDLLTNYKLDITDKEPNWSLKYYWKNITSRDFYLPCLHIFVLEYLIQGTGAIATSIYSIDIFKQATGYEQLSKYAAFIVNSLILTGFLTSIVLTKYLNKKTFILWGTIIGVLCTIIIALITYLQSIGTLSKGAHGFLFICLYILSVAIGVLPVAHSVSSTLMPVRHRGAGGVIYVLIICILHTVTLKLTPYIMLYYHLWSLYSVFAVNGIICGLLIWKFVPEIKGRTLPEIEYFYKYGHFNNSKDHSNCNEQMLVENINVT